MLLIKLEFSKIYFLVFVFKVILVKWVDFVFILIDFFILRNFIEKVKLNKVIFKRKIVYINKDNGK